MHKDIKFAFDTRNKDVRAYLEDWIRVCEPYIFKLVDENPFSDRMRLLLRNQALSKRPILNLKGEVKPSNCLGTALWVSGLLKTEQPVHIYTPEMEEHLVNPGIEAGSFVITYHEDKHINHAGILLGRIDPFHIMFSQRGACKRFCLEVYFEGANWKKIRLLPPEYYLPATLQG